MLIGYARLSTSGENPDLQKEALDHAGVDRLFVDVATGARGDRPQLEQALAKLRQGDTLVVWKLDRVGRSVRHLSDTVEDLSRRGIGFRSLKENLDTTTTIGKLTFHAFAWLADFESDLIREQTRAERANAQGPGRQRGPRPKLDLARRAEAVTLYQDARHSVDDICRKLQISPRTLYRYLQKVSTRKAGKKPKVKTGEEVATFNRQQA